MYVFFRSFSLVILTTLEFFRQKLNAYRPGKSKWEYTMWKLQDFSATQILREINFGHFEAPMSSSEF